MATITVKNIPDRLYDELKMLAKIRHRSLNKEIINCLESSLAKSGMPPEDIRARAEMFRDTIVCKIEPADVEKIVSQGL